MPFHVPEPAHKDESVLTFDYDFARGGFSLNFCEDDGSDIRPMFNGLTSAVLDPDGKMVALRSFWADRGGLPIRLLHGVVWRGTHKITGPILSTSLFQLHQEPNSLALWFGTEKEMPLQHWTTRHDPEFQTTLYFSSKKALGGYPFPGIGGRPECHMLAGIKVDLKTTVVRYPVSSLSIFCEDFK